MPLTALDVLLVYNIVNTMDKGVGPMWEAA